MTSNYILGWNLPLRRSKFTITEENEKEKLPRKIMKLKQNKSESETLDPPFVKHSLIRVQTCLIHT